MNIFQQVFKPCGEGLFINVRNINYIDEEEGGFYRLHFIGGEIIEVDYGSYEKLSALKFPI